MLIYYKHQNGGTENPLTDIGNLLPDRRINFERTLQQALPLEDMDCRIIKGSTLIVHAHGFCHNETGMIKTRSNGAQRSDKYVSNIISKLINGNNISKVILFVCNALRHDWQAAIQAAVAEGEEGKLYLSRDGESRERRQVRVIGTDGIFYNSGTGFYVDGDRNRIHNYKWLSELKPEDGTIDGWFAVNVSL